MRIEIVVGATRITFFKDDCTLLEISYEALSKKPQLLDLGLLLVESLVKEEVEKSGGVKQ